MTNPIPVEPSDALTAEAAAAAAVEPPGHDRGRRRDKRVLRSGAASSAFQVFSALCNLATVPLVIRRLTPQSFGIWITLSSLMVLLGFLDLGVGSALIGGVARAQANGDRERAQELVSSAFFGLLGLAAVIAAIFVFAYPHIPWADVLGVASPADRADAARAVAIVVAGILVSIPLSVAARAQTGLQEGEAVMLWRGIGIAVQLVVVVVLFVLKAGLLPFIVALVAGPVLGSVLNSVALFWGRRPWLHARRSRASLQTFQSLGTTGSLFFLLMVSATLAYQADALIVAHYLGAAKASEYGVPLRLFMFVPSIVNLALMPLWPAYADAKESGDVAWVRRTFRRSLLFAVVANGAAGLVLLAAGRAVLRIWVGDAVMPTNLFLGALFVYVVVWGISGAMAMLFNGFHIVKFQIVISLSMVALNLPLSIALLPSMGVAGPVVATIAVQTVIVLIPSFLYKRRLLDGLGATTSGAPVAQPYWGR